MDKHSLSLSHVYAVFYISLNHWNVVLSTLHITIELYANPYYEENVYQYLKTVLEALFGCYVCEYIITPRTDPMTLRPPSWPANSAER